MRYYKESRNEPSVLKKEEIVPGHLTILRQVFQQVVPRSPGNPARDTKKNRIAGAVYDVNTLGVACMHCQILYIHRIQE
jgi:hypothetical protein